MLALEDQDKKWNARKTGIKEEEEGKKSSAEKRRVTEQILHQHKLLPLLELHKITFFQETCASPRWKELA